MYIINLFGRDGIGFMNIKIDKSGTILTDENTIIKIIDTVAITVYKTKDLKIYVPDLIFEETAMDMIHDKKMIYNNNFKDCVYDNLLKLIRKNGDGYDFYFTGLNMFRLTREYYDIKEHCDKMRVIEDRLKYIVVGRLGEKIEEKLV